MTGTDWMAALAAVVIFGMIWLRTKVQYRQRGVTLRLAPAGWKYFGAALLVMLLGWWVAPLLSPLIAGPHPQPMMPTMLRVGWSLATYYVFIGVHQLVRSKAGGVFVASDASSPQS